MGKELKKYLYVLFVSLFWVTNLTSAISQGILQSTPSSLSLTLDTSRVAWGERAEITLRFGKGVNEGFEGWPLWKDTIPGGLEILSTSKLDTLAPSNSDPDEWDMIVEQSWVVTGWDSGFAFIPSIKIGNDSTYPLILQIVPTRTDGAIEIKNAADIIQVDWSLTERLEKAIPWVAVILGLVILFFLIKYLYNLWRNHEVLAEIIEIDTPYIPPHIIALKELKLLEERQSWNKGEAKTFHVQLSKIIRTYLDERFEISSLEKTTREVSDLINLLNINSSDKSKLVFALRLGDQIKFAKYRALSEDHSRSISVCIEFVENTMETTEDAEPTKAIAE